MLNWGLILEELGLRNEPSTCVAGVGCWAGVPQDLVEKLNKYFGGKYCISGFRSNRNGERRGRDTVQKVWMYHVWYSYYLQNEELC